MKNYKILLAVAILIVIGVLVMVQKPSLNPLGSVSVGNAYLATSTRNFNGAALTNLTRLKGSGNECVGGELSRVTITGANTGIIYFWDATTTNVNLRSSSQASSTIFIGSIPASAAANSYDFDADLKCGLIYELTTGLAPTSTIMYR
jgi:hypothetical protein